jgi:hypothetical protein
MPGRRCCRAISPADPRAALSRRRRDDRLEIAYEAARLAKALFRHQPEALELRVVDAGHTMRVWEVTADEALTVMFAHLARIGLATLRE